MSHKIHSYCVTIFCVLFLSIACLSAQAGDDVQVSLGQVRFGTEDFFSLREIGFREDKVNFNKGWLGIFMENAEGKGILVKEITKGSPADDAGLMTGDVITKINNESTIGVDNLNLIQFKKIMETTGAGGAPELTVSRNGTETVCRPKLIAKLLKQSNAPVSSFPWLKEMSLADLSQKSFMEFAVQNEQFKEKLGMAVQRIGEEVFVREGFQVNEAANPLRLSIVDYIMLHPFDTARIGQNIHDNLVEKNVGTQLAFAAELLDVSSQQMPDTGENGVKSQEATAVHSPQEQFQSLINGLASCVSLVKESFGDLSRDEFEFLYHNTQKVWLPDEKIDAQNLARLLTFSQKVGFEKLFQAASLLLSKLVLEGSERGIAGIKKPSHEGTQIKLSPCNLPESMHCQHTQGNPAGNDPKNFAGDILFVQDTKVGKIVVGGTGASYYYADAAVIIDLGGDDYYFNNGGASSADIPVSLCIDFSGNDVYNAAHAFAQGTGRFGVGVLMDFEGNDKYLGQSFAQGASLFGVGLLVDNDGDDFYSGHVLNQGVGFFGAGLLLDAAGNDVYFSGLLAQGVGLTKGLGALIDSRGNDYYYTGGKYPDFRDPDKSFQSMSQGMGMGIRPEESIVGASGGVGVLIDEKGNDHYQGDYFSQGSGYYFSLGFLCDKDGADRYFAGRYAQGAGIHSAIGLLEDKSGDDRYECSLGVSQGCGHDTGIGFLADYSGNDTYHSETSSQGIGLEKGLGVLADFSGNDKYRANDNSQGFSSPSKTEDVIGMGMLLDNQGDGDIFHDPIRENILLYRAGGGVVLNK